MIESVFALLVKLAVVYVGCGLLVAMLFLARWIKAFDPSAKDGSWGFRVLVVPGIVALWPVILVKVRAISRGGRATGEAETPVRQESLRRNHGLAFIALAILGSLLFAVAFNWRAPRWEDTPLVEMATKLNAP